MFLCCSSTPHFNNPKIITFSDAETFATYQIGNCEGDLINYTMHPSHNAYMHTKMQYKEIFAHKKTNNVIDSDQCPNDMLKRSLTNSIIHSCLLEE